MKSPENYHENTLTDEINAILPVLFIVSDALSTSVLDIDKGCAWILGCVRDHLTQAVHDHAEDLKEGVMI